MFCRVCFRQTKLPGPKLPKWHEAGNLLHHAEIVRGDVDRAFGECAWFRRYLHHALHRACFPRARSRGWAYPDNDGGVTLKIGTQTAFDDRTQLSEILAMPEDKSGIQNPPGGAFGAKKI